MKSHIFFLFLFLLSGYGARGQKTYDFKLGKVKGTFVVKFLISADPISGRGMGIDKAYLGTVVKTIDASTYTNYKIIAQITELSVSPDSRYDVALIAPFIDRYYPLKVPTGIAKVTGPIKLQSNGTSSGNINFDVNEDKLEKDNKSKIQFDVKLEAGEEWKIITIKSPDFSIVPRNANASQNKDDNTGNNQEMVNQPPPPGTGAQPNNPPPADAGAQNSNTGKIENITPLATSQPGTGGVLSSGQQREAEVLRQFSQNNSGGNAGGKANKTPSEEDKDWKALDKTDCAAVKRFLTTYKIGTYTIPALQSLNRVCRLPAPVYAAIGEKKYVLQINDRVELSPDWGVLKVEVPAWIQEIGRVGDIRKCQTRITILFTEDKAATIRIKDYTGAEVSVTIDPGIPALNARVTEQENAIIVDNMKGGKGDYSVMLYRNNMYYSMIEVKGKASVSIDKSELPEGDYQVFLTDERKSEQFPLRDFANVREVTLWDYLFWPLVISVILGVIGVSGYFFYQRYTDKLKVSEGYKEKIKINTISKSVGNATSPAGETESKRNVQVKVSAKAPPPLAVKPPETTGDPWSRVESVPDFVTQNGRENYYPLILSDLWNSSMVKEIFLHNRFASRVHDFIFEENSQLQLRGEAIREIGGFILGKKIEIQPGGEYQLVMERFVNIEPEDNSVYQIEFGPKAWSELERQRDDFYRDMEYELLGWFHTHPGHGLFLSKPDVSIQQTFFKQKFHVAFELDSVQSEKNLDYMFGIFSWKKGSGLNNLDDLAGSWFNWSDVAQWMSRAKKY